MNKKQPISILILATLPDSGIKSLGSKSLLLYKNKYIIEYQLDTIKQSLKGIEHDITIMSGFDSNRLYKTLDPIISGRNIKIIKQNSDGLNFCGSFIQGIEHTKHDNIISINYGSVFKPSIISSLIQQRNTNLVGVSKDHTVNNNLNTGCYFEKNNEVLNIFFNLGEYKYLDMNYWSSDTIRYIRSNHSRLNNNFKNRFMFEIINYLIDNNHTFKAQHTKISDFVFVDSLKSFTKSKRILAYATNKKTKY